MFAWTAAQQCRVVKYVLYVQVANHPSLVNCDERLSSLLGQKTVRVSSFSERISPMVTRVPTPMLDYTIRLSTL